jgi:hypothetical protein
MANHDPEIPAANLTICAVGYRARCTAAGGTNLGRLILPYSDVGGRPISNSAVFHAHARVRIERDRAVGFEVYDDREPN